MSSIRLYDNYNSDATKIPNAFIDHHMTHSDGEYVKIFLFLLRSLNASPDDLSLQSLAEHFGCSQENISQALRYWEEMGLLKLEFRCGSLCGVCICQDALRHKQTPARNKKPETNLTRAFSEAVTRPEVYTPEQMEAFAEKNDIRELFYIAEQYLERSLNQTDLNHLLCWYDKLHLSPDLIEYLIEHCVSNGHTSLYYMEKLAEELSAGGIFDLTQAKAYLKRASEVYRVVMQAFGISGRQLNPTEQRYISHWTKTLGFSAQMIGEACARTIANAHKPSFPYADSILCKWQREQIYTPEALKQSDERFLRSRKPLQTVKTTGGNTKFTAFTQRDTNYDELQRQLIQKSQVMES